MKSIRTLTILLFLLICVITQAQNRLIAMSNLELRKSPNINGQFIRTVVKGSSMRYCNKRTRGWVKVNFKGSFGYVMLKHTSFNRRYPNQLPISKSDKEYSLKSNVSDVNHDKNSTGNRVQSPKTNDRVPQGSTKKGLYEANNIKNQAQNRLIATSNLELRKSPNINGKFIMRVAKGSLMRYCNKRTRGWIKVNFKGSFGYAMLKHTSFNQTYSNKLSK